MSKATNLPKDVFVSLQDLLKMEAFARNFSFLARKQKVRSVLGGKHASKLRGRGLDFEEVRNYVAGDDIRNIDWKVTARTQKTQTKVFSEEKEKPALIVVDQSKTMFFGSQRKTKSVVAAELAALVSFRVLKEGDRVGGIVIADEGIDIIFPKRDRKNILRFFDKIVERNHQLADSRPIEFEEVLKDTMGKIRNMVTHDFLIFIISDFQRYSPQVIKFIAQLAQHNDVILSKIYDPMERDFPTEKIIASAQAQQIVIDGKNATIRQRFKEGFDSDFNSFEMIMKKHKVPVISINTFEDVDVQLKNILSGVRK